MPACVVQADGSGAAGSPRRRAHDHARFVLAEARGTAADVGDGRPRTARGRGCQGRRHGDARGGARVLVRAGDQRVCDGAAGARARCPPQDAQSPRVRGVVPKRVVHRSATTDSRHPRRTAGSNSWTVCWRERRTHPARWRRISINWRASSASPRSWRGSRRRSRARRTPCSFVWPTSACGLASPVPLPPPAAPPAAVLSEPPYCVCATTLRRFQSLKRRMGRRPLAHVPNMLPFGRVLEAADRVWEDLHAPAAETMSPHALASDLMVAFGLFILSDMPSIRCAPGRTACRVPAHARGRWRRAADTRRAVRRRPADVYGLLLDVGVRRHFHLPPVVSEAASRVLRMTYRTTGRVMLGPSSSANPAAPLTFYFDHAAWIEHDPRFSQVLVGGYKMRACVRARCRTVVSPDGASIT